MDRVLRVIDHTRCGGIRHRLELNGERRALAGAATLGAYRAAVQLHQGTHDRESETEAAMLAADRSVGLPEPFEGERQKTRIDAFAVVGHPDACGTCPRILERHIHHASGFAELHRVRQQVPHHLLQALRIAVGHRVGGREMRAELNLPGVCRRLHHIDRRGNDRAQIDGLTIQLDAAGDDARHVENIVDQAGLEARVAIDRLEGLPGRGRVFGAGEQQCVHPTIALSGVRSSCDNVARN